MHVAPLLLAYLLLGLWFAVGSTVLLRLGFRSNRLQLALLAPAVGLACCLLPVFWLNMSGFPVLRFARPLTGVLLVVGVTGLLVYRNLVPWQMLALFAMPVLASILLAGAPLLIDGLVWVSYANDDWANYNLAATRFMREGFFSAPDVDAIRRGENYPDLFWFIHVSDGGRPGSELLLAWVAGVFRVSPFRIFMPVIVALHGTALASAAALALANPRLRTPALAGLCLLALAPLFFHGTLRQLIGQDGGLALALALSSLTLVPLPRLFRWRSAIAVPLMLAASLVVYPEALPFCGVGFILYQLARVRRSARQLRPRHAAGAALMVVLLGAFCGGYLINVTGFLLRQAGYAFKTSEAKGALFPYFMVPSGIADFWGLQNLGQLPAEPYLSSSIFAGLLLFAALAVALLIGVRRAFPPAFIALAMAILAAKLALSHVDFGLFKIAMYAQPLVFSTLCFSLWTLMRARRAAALVGVLCLPLAWNSVSQVWSSANSYRGLSMADSLPFNLNPPTDGQCSVAYDMPDIVRAKIRAGFIGCSRVFPARNMFPNERSSGDRRVFGGTKVTQIADLDSKRLKVDQSPLRFPTRDGVVFTEISDIDYGQVNQLGIDVRASNIVNASERDEGKEVLARADELSNFLIFTNSTLGEHYYLPLRPDDIGYYETEPDYFVRGGAMAALGRFLVFRVHNPTSRVRLLLNITATLNHDGSSLLPEASVAGASWQPIGLVGRGSARVLSPPLQVLSAPSGSFLLLDLGDKFHQFKTPTAGLMGLYGTNYSLDYRQFTAFGRNIELVDADSYNENDKPQALRRFPADLADPRLEYSGIYEDGWVSEKAFLTLAGRHGAHRVVVRGELPAWTGLATSDVTLQVNGGPPIVMAMTPGRFELEAPAGEGRQEITLTFGRSFSMPAGDERPASALLTSVSVQ